MRNNGRQRRHELLERGVCHDVPSGSDAFEEQGAAAAPKGCVRDERPVAPAPGRVHDQGMGQEEYGDYSIDDETQLQPEDTLDFHGVEDVLDEGIVTRESWSPGQGFGNTHAEELRGETLDQRFRQEEPDQDPGSDLWDEDDLDDDQVGDVRSGRLVASDDVDDRFVYDAGIDGAGASAEEAAMHVIEE